MAAEPLSVSRLRLIRDSVNAALPDTHFAIVVICPFLDVGGSGDLQSFATAPVSPLGQAKILAPMLAHAIQTANDT